MNFITVLLTLLSASSYGGQSVELNISAEIPNYCSFKIDSSSLIKGFDLSKPGPAHAATLKLDCNLNSNYAIKAYSRNAFNLTDGRNKIPYTIFIKDHGEFKVNSATEKEFTPKVNIKSKSYDVMINYKNSTTIAGNYIDNIIFELNTE